MQGHQIDGGYKLVNIGDLRVPGHVMPTDLSI